MKKKQSPRVRRQNAGRAHKPTNTTGHSMAYDRVPHGTPPVAVPPCLVPFLQTRNYAKLAEALRAEPELVQHPLVVRALKHAFTQGRIRFATPPGRRGRWTRIKGMSHCKACAKSGEPCMKHVSILDDLELLGQYDELLGLLRREPVRRQKGETREPYRHRLEDVLRDAYDRSSLAWKLPEPPSYDRHIFLGEARPLTPKELEACMNEPVAMESVPILESRLTIAVMRALRERRASTRDRLICHLLAEHRSSSHTVIRSRIQAARKLEKELDPT